MEDKPVYDKNSARNKDIESLVRHLNLPYDDPIVEALTEAWNAGYVEGVTEAAIKEFERRRNEEQH